MTTYEYPTVEWVKDPVDLETGLPSGRRIARRHFGDCDHWYRNGDDSLVGGPATLATDEQMVSVAPCGDCARRARQSGHPESGERIDSYEAVRQFWWVSQGYNYELAIKQQTLWSLPKKARELPDRRLLKQMRSGDIVLHYANHYLRAVSVVRTPWQPATRPEGYQMRPGDGDDGWLVEVEVQQADLNLHFREIASLIERGAPGPLDKNGTPRRLYVAVLSERQANVLLSAAGASVPSARPAPDLPGAPDTVLGLDTTDASAVSRVRREQAYLRRYLLAGRSEAPCALCGRILPQHLLVAAHVVPRRLLDDAERLDFRGSAMLACALGCDALFEWGHIVVDDAGVVQAGHKSGGVAASEAVAALEGRRCTAHSQYTAQRFAQHRASHEVPG
ncbi:hypothetical protein BH09ACT11_BH09ACT11_12520 [soil metagenome]